MKRSIYMILTAILLAGLLSLLPGCGNGADDSSDDADSGKNYEIVDSAIFNGKWIPSSLNAMENAIEISDGKVTWYVWNYAESRFITMNEWIQQMLDENETIDSAEFTAELMGNQLMMKLTTTSFDGIQSEDPVSGTLLLKDDTLTLLLSGGSLSNSDDTVVFTRTNAPITEYTRDAG